MLAVLGGGAIAYQVGKRKGAQGALPAARSAAAKALLDRTIKDVRVDDIVQHDGHDWLVEGVVAYDEDGHRWRAARTLDAPDERWYVIGLERTGAPQVRAMRKVDLKLEGYPPEQLDVDGKTFRLAQRGNATASATGVFKDLPGQAGPVTDHSLRIRWWRYATGTGETLWVEQLGEGFRVLAGTTVPIDQVDLLAGS